MTNREFVVEYARQYQGDGREVELFLRDGVEWACVGHNASHQFYLGVDAEGNLWQRASGEGEGEPRDPKREQLPGESERDYELYELGWEHANPCWGYNEPYRVTQETVGYIGHY